MAETKEMTNVVLLEETHRPLIYDLENFYVVEEINDVNPAECSNEEWRDNVHSYISVQELLDFYLKNRKEATNA
jgi:hypothetical protein